MLLLELSYQSFMPSSVVKKASAMANGHFNYGIVCFDNHTVPRGTRQQVLQALWTTFEN